MKLLIPLITICFTISLLYCAPSTTSNVPKISSLINNEQSIPATEDLMREHGILRRIFLIYEEIIRQLDHAKPPIKQLNDALAIEQEFIEAYHEKNEEAYLFPLFEKKRRDVALVQTLKKQHVRAHSLRSKLKTLIVPSRILDKSDIIAIKKVLEEFMTMYRPHADREDTVLFPQLRDLMSEQEFIQLGTTFDEIEERMFKGNGFEEMVKKVAIIEKELGIYELDKFTAPLVSE